MNCVARDDVCQGVYRKWILVSGAGSRPMIRRKIAEERDGRKPDVAKLIDVLRPGEFICVRRGDFLIETRQRRLEAPCEPKSSEKKNSLYIVHVIEYLANRPLLWSV